MPSRFFVIAWNFYIFSDPEDLISNYPSKEENRWNTRPFWGLWRPGDRSPERPWRWGSRFCSPWFLLFCSACQLGGEVGTHTLAFSKAQLRPLGNHCGGRSGRALFLAPNWFSCSPCCLWLHCFPGLRLAVLTSSFSSASCPAPFPAANSLSLRSQAGLGDCWLIVNPRKGLGLIVPQAVTSHRGCSQPAAEPVWAQLASDCSPFNCPCPWGPSSKKKVLQLQRCTSEHLLNVSCFYRVPCFQLLLLGRKDTHRMAFHLIPRDDSVQMSQETGGLLWGEMGASSGKATYLPLFECGVSSCPFHLALKAGSDSQAK